MYIIFDTETTGLPRDWKAPVTDTSTWPRVVQIAWQVHDDMGRLVEQKDFLVRPDGFDVPYDAERIHGISTELALKYGDSLEDVLFLFNKALEKADFVVGQNVGFDLNVVGCEFIRLNTNSRLLEMPVLDTCTEATAELCQLPGGRGGRPKLPTLTELHEYLFHEPFAEAHNATADVEATTRCFLELLRREHYSIEQLKCKEDYLRDFRKLNTETFALIGLKHLNLKEESAKLKQVKTEGQGATFLKNESILDGEWVNGRLFFD
jgi:DNA polymerase-3 subunit alpha